MNYRLDLDDKNKTRAGIITSIMGLYKYLLGSRKSVVTAFFFLMVNSLVFIVTPFLIGDITNKFIPSADKQGLIESVLFLLLIYIVGAIASYQQIKIMGRVGQVILFKLRNDIFNKLQSLPLQFFNENKTGDLISRVNNDTEKLNQAFSETILRFFGNIFVIIGIGIVMIILNYKLGLIALGVFGIILIITLVLSPWIRSTNSNSLQKLGELSAEIQESLSNFRVTVVFNRRDYFRKSFEKANEHNRRAVTWASISNGILQPVYNFSGSIASMLIFIFGIELLILDPIKAGSIPEFGTLISFLLYSESFFNPLREMATLFSQLQTAVAAWGRVRRILGLSSNLVKIDSSDKPDEKSKLIISFENVSFGYIKDDMVIKKMNMELERGKTYALVGPTGGGKSTTAALMARLYDATEGKVLLNGKDIRSYKKSELTKIIGFILQEPLLFTGSLAENIKYGNTELTDINDNLLESKLKELGLLKLIERFENGLQTQIKGGSDNISLGQKQLIAFVRILLRQPKLLILDEATANIDTVTEQLLEEIIQKLPKETTKVIIAHRLNTIENADQIFFISAGQLEKPLDFSSALNLINSNNKRS